MNVIHQMAKLFSKIDANKLWHDVPNEETVIFAKIGKDLFNISKVMVRKTKWPRFFGLPNVLVVIALHSSSTPTYGKRSQIFFTAR